MSTKDLDRGGARSGGDEAPEGFASAMTLDQLEVLVAIEEAGSFSGAARRLRRSQGAVSYHVAALEAQLGLALFDRSGHSARWTEAGRAVLARAVEVLDGLAALRATARGLGQGTEAEVVVAVDVMCSPGWLAATLGRFEAAWPHVRLTLRSGTLDTVVEWVRGGDAALGITGMSALPDGLVARVCAQVPWVVVCAPSHALASAPAPIDDAALARHTHLIVSDEGAGAARGPGEVFPSTRRWHVGDMGLRLALLEAGLGWSMMPLARVADALATGRLVALDVARFAAAPPLTLRVIHRQDRPPGRAGQWLLDALLDAQDRPGG